ncbi:MAG: hypothetical protein ACOC34_03375 [Thermotogota bacterium]
MKRIDMILAFLIVTIMLFTGCGEPVIVDIVPSKPVLTSPIDSEQATALRLDWDAALRASSYNVYLGKTLGTMALIAQNVTNTFYDVTGLDPSSLYYWKVVAKNNAGVTDSDTKTFSTRALRAGNYVEIQDVTTNSGSEFLINLKGNLSDIRAIEIILQFSPNEIILAPTESVNEITLMGPLADAGMGLISFGSNTLTLTLSLENNFSLNHEVFAQITCDAKDFSGISQITIGTDSQVIDENFNTINFNKTDIGFVFVR